MKNKVALIIGAGDAIGSAIARKFAKRGLTICATRRNEDKLKPLIEEISAAGGKAFGFGCDARKEDPADQPHAREHNVSLRLGRHHLILYK